MESLILEEFQYMIDQQIRRNGSLIDMLTKLETSGGKLNRALVKAVTHCGCISLDLKRKCTDCSDAKGRAKISGTLCEGCREEVERAMGEHLFYLTAMLSPLDLSLYDLFLGEAQRQKMLGKYNLR